MRSRTSSSLLYLFFTAFITGWWSAAFHTATPSPQTIYPESIDTLALKTSTLFEALSPLQRDDIQKALTGDYNLMVKLIAQWDQDATALAQRNVNGIQRLPHETYLQAQILGRLLLDSTSENLRQLNCKINLDYIQDDHGHLVKIEDTFQHYLPQSYVAATFLLAIAQPKEILALPKGLRYLPQLYDQHLLAQIPMNVNHTYGEKLTQCHPDLAFVAPYSHPPALDAFRNQGIQLYTIKNLDSIKDIQNALLKIGHASNHILEAQLLAIFMEASLLCIDNRLCTLQSPQHSVEPPQKLLYLFYHQHYMLPTSKSLTGQLMCRIVDQCPKLSCFLPKSQTEWRIPFELEKIISSNPDYLVISTSNRQETTKALNTPSPLSRLKAYETNQIYLVDESTQESPTQYLVLAYFDLFQTIAATYL